MRNLCRIFIGSAAVLALAGFNMALAAAPVPLAAPLPSQLNAKCLAVTAPDTVQSGQVFSASVNVQNTGSGAWKAFAFYLGAQNPPLNTRWLLSRLSLFKTVQPGGSTVFQSPQFRAPNQTGTFDFSWQMFTYAPGLKMTWFGETCSKKILVQKPSADMAIEKTASGSFINGSDIVYNLLVENKGSSKAVYVRVNDPIPSGLVFKSSQGSACYRSWNTIYCSKNSMESGETVVFPLVFTVKSSCGKKITNQASVSSSTYDPNTKNNVSRVQNTVTCQAPKADLSITKTGPVEVNRDSTMIYIVTAANAGPDATYVLVKDSVPSGLEFNASMSTAGCTLSGTTVVCPAGSMLAGQQKAFNLAFNVPTVQNCTPTTVQNQAAVSSLVTDPDWTNNRSQTVTTSLQCPVVNGNLFITGKALSSSDIVVANQKNVTLLRFESHATDGDVLLTQATFGADNSANATNYVLWVDTDNNGVVDTILQKNVASVSNVVRFDSITGGGYVIPNSQTSVFEVHADVSSSLLAGTLQEAFATSVANYIEAKQLNGPDLTGIKTDGSCPVSSCAITVVTTPSTVFSFKNQGDLYVTKSTTPIRNRQLLGGTLADNVLNLKLHAEAEPIDVTKIRFSLNGSSNDIDRLELFKPGDRMSFAAATIGGCGTDTVPANTFCASMQSQQLIVDKGSDMTVLVKPRMRSDNDGAVSGHDATFGLISSGSPAVEARGVNSSNNLSPNDGDSSAEGEVFIGTNTASPDQTITGNRNVTVLSKVTSITNADPNPNGTSIPTGAQRAIAQFKFATAPHNNSRNGMNKVAMATVLFNVNATNVGISAAGFAGYNKADPTQVVLCYPMANDGTPLSGTGQVTGAFLVSCAFSGSPVNNEIDMGTDATFVLRADVLNAKINSSQTSTLQVSLQNFSDINLSGSFGPFSSHLTWQDKDNGGSTVLRWIEYLDTVINGTMYQD